MLRTSKGTAEGKAELERERQSVATLPLPLKELICEKILEVCEGAYGRFLQAIILTGSWARNEATVTRQNSGWAVASDAEFLLVFDKQAALPGAAILRSLAHRIESNLLQDGVQSHVSVGAVVPSYLRSLQPRIFTYELRSCGQVIWGDKSVLSLVPCYSPTDISLEDAWRLLCNRMIEQVQVLDECVHEDGILLGTEEQASKVRYRAVKLLLDVATSFLLFQGAYEPTYRGRARSLRRLAGNPLDQKAAPFQLAPFADQVDACTQYKLDGAHLESFFPSWDQEELTLTLCEQASIYAQLLWRWELARLTGTQGQRSNTELGKLWMKQQPVLHRLRGWLSVLRRAGWLRTYKEWPRWARLGWQGSPRYWVYAAASELFFRLPCLLRGRDTQYGLQSDWHVMRELLPLVQNNGFEKGRPAWSQLAREIICNYEQFLVGTTS